MLKVLLSLFFFAQSSFAGYSPKYSDIARFASSPKKDSFFFYTLAPDIKTTGPVIDFVTPSKTNKQEYVQNLFGYIIKKASQLYKINQGELDAKHFGAGNISFYPYIPGSNKNYSFYTYLITALAVFQHESRLSHFREVPSEYCSQKKNDLTYSKKKSGYMGRYALQLQESIFRNPYNILTPNCDNLKTQKAVTQLISSSNHDDFGIGQLNIYWHPLVISEEFAFNVYNSIDYSLSYLLEGFSRVRHIIEEIKIFNKKESTKYANCDFWSQPFSTGRTLDKPYYNLVRATWAGTYNHGAPGNPDKVCRFAESNNHDKGFQQTLNSIVLNSNSFYHRYLPENSIERMALNEIVFNFKNIFTQGEQPESNIYLNLLSTQNYKSTENADPKQYIYSNHSPYDSTHFLTTQSYANFRKINPETDSTKICGQIRQLNTNQATSLKVLGSYKSFKNEKYKDDKWFVVAIPDYAPFVVYNDDPECHDESKNIYTSDGSKVYMIHSSLLIPIEKKVKYRGKLDKNITTINIYKHQSYNSGIVDIIIQKRNNNNKHIDIEILNTNDSAGTPQWYYIKTIDHTYGWVPAKYVKKVEVP